MKTCPAIYISSILIILMMLHGIKGMGQSLLDRKVSIQANNMKLGSALQLIAEKGNFTFSYNSNILPLDSLVKLQAENVSVEEALDHLLNRQYEYKEAYNFLMLRYAPRQMSMVLQESFNYPSRFVIQGQIVDNLTRLPVADASIYEKQLLQSVLTDKQGFFTLKLKNFPQTINVTVSKENYKEINTIFLSEVIVRPARTGISGDYETGDLARVERTRLGRLLVTSEQKIQSLNIGNFIAQAPVQFSLGPGLSTHGSLSGQVMNIFSINATGGYTAGVQGMEIGLLYNINKKNVEWFQFGGAFNLVGGKVSGLQIAGLYNNVLDSANAVQISLGYNRVAGPFRGIQIGGLYNRVKDNFSGSQISTGHNRVEGAFKGIQFGISNHSKSFSGLRIGLIGNISSQSTTGGQIAGIFNYTKTLKGFQAGLLNISGAPGGYHIGLVNIVKDGYRKLSLTSNETVDLNLAIKTGNKKLYSILMYGMNRSSTNRLQAFGLGFGKPLDIYKQVSVNPEISSRYIHLGNWKNTNLLNRLDLNLNFKLNKWIGMETGPALSVFYSNQTDRYANYAVVSRNNKGFSFSNPKYKSWVGWNLGLTFF